MPKGHIMQVVRKEANNANREIEMEIGTQVIRKNYKGGIGTIERLSAFRSGKTKAYVRWHNALNLFHSGITDNHSTVSLRYE